MLPTIGMAVQRERRLREGEDEIIEGKNVYVLVIMSSLPFSLIQIEASIADLRAATCHSLLLSASVHFRTQLLTHFILFYFGSTHLSLFCFRSKLAFGLLLRHCLCKQTSASRNAQAQLQAV